MMAANGEGSRQAAAAPAGASESFDSKSQVGLGVDIVDIERMDAILERTPSFADRVFSPEECAYCRDKARPAAHFAARFAVKEAVVKALGTGFSEGIGPRDIEVRHNAKGRPYAVLSGAAKEMAARLGVVDLPISLSHTHVEAVACAMAITRESREAVAARRDPMDDLMASFKDLRGMLDDMPGGTQAEAEARAAEAALRESDDCAAAGSAAESGLCSAAADDGEVE